MGECSASSCDTHDVGKVIWDEDGKRPKGRNPWDGFCLRLEALNELGRKRKARMRGISAVDIQELLKFLGGSRWMKARRHMQRSLQGHNQGRNQGHNQGHK